MHLCCLALLLVASSVQGQELDHTQYYLNLPGVNAGFTGIEDYMDTRFSYRQGWNSFNVKNNYTYVSAYGALNNFTRTALSNNTLRLSDPEGLKRTQVEKKLMRKHGIGGMITSRAIGPYKATSLNLNYAYHLPVTPTMNMAFGSRIAYNAQRIDFAGYTVRDEVNDEFYQQIMRSNQGNTGTFLMDFGYVLYSPKFYFGISSNGLISTHVSGNSVVELEQTSRVQVQTALTAIHLGSELIFSPALRVTYAKNYDLMMSLNGRLIYRNFIYAGGGYTNSSPKMSLLFGVNVNGKFSVNYAFDKYLSELNNFNVSVHEFVLGMALFNKYGAPGKMW